MTPFEDLIRSLGDKIGTPLHVDPHQSCCLEFINGVTAQIDLDGSADKILVGTSIARLSAGIYRENILKQALIVNTLHAGKFGVLAYSDKNDQLVLFKYLPLNSTHADELFEFLKGFVEHASLWQEAIKSGGVPQIVP